MQAGRRHRISKTPVKGLWRVRIRLAELARAPEGEERRRHARGELFREIRALKGSKASESRLALLELARSGVEPGAGAAAGRLGRAG